MKNSRLLDFEKLKFEIHDSMRYDDVGDYYDHTIIAYNMKDEIINNAILLHEFIEYTLIKSAGLSSEMIDKFDTDSKHKFEFPEEYKLYRKFHQLANMVEKRFVENLGLNWAQHDNNLATTQVEIAVQQATDELHQKNLTEKAIEKLKSIVKATFPENNS